MRSTMASLSARVSVAGKYRITSASAFIAAQGARSLSRQPRKRTRDPVRSAMSVGKWDSVGTLQTVEYADVHHGLQQGQGTTGNDFDHAQQRQMHFLMQAAAGECRRHQDNYRGRSQAPVAGIVLPQHGHQDRK